MAWAIIFSASCPAPSCSMPRSRSPNATPFDRLLQALAQASNGNYKPSAIVLNTSDAFMLHSLKDTQGRYIGGGPYEGLLNLLLDHPVGRYERPARRTISFWATFRERSDLGSFQMLRF